MRIERRIMGTTITLLLLTAGIVGIVIIPTVFRVKSLTDELAQQQMEIERHYALRNYVKQTLADIDTAQGQLDKLRGTTIAEGEELEFIQALEHAASVAGVEQDISLETVNETELTLWEKEIPLRVHVSGPFPSVMSWLNEVEHLDYYVLFDSISVSAQRIGGVPDPAGRVEAQFAGRVYWLADSAPYFLDFHTLPDSTTDENADDTDEAENEE